ncbi:MAG: hypothetical protein EZS28_020196, partial [Streblomastix strix]
MTVTLGVIDHLRFRVLVEDRFMLNMSNREVFENLRTQYGTISPEEKTIANLRREYIQNKTIVTAAIPTGRPKITGLGPQVTEIILADHHISVKRLSLVFGHDKKTIRRIISDETDFIQVALRWIPHKLNESHKIKRVDYAKSMITELVNLKNFHLKESQRVTRHGFTWITTMINSGFIKVRVDLNDIESFCGSVKCLPFNCVFSVPKRQKSHGLMSGEQGGCSILRKMEFSKNYLVKQELWIGALSKWRAQSPFDKG